VATIIALVSPEVAMPFLVAAVVLLAVLCLLNMMITFAVLRRLRSHEERLAARPAGRSSGVDALVGRELPEFDATSTAGAAVSRSDLLGQARVLGVFSATCEPCHEQARAFAAGYDRPSVPESR
jgi:hypothetical protein